MFGDDEEIDEFEDYFEDSEEGDPYEYMENGGFFDDIDEDVEDEDREVVISSINESLDMFKRFSKYN